MPTSSGGACARRFSETGEKGGNVHSPAAGDFLCARHAVLFEHEPGRFFGATEILADISRTPHEIVGCREGL